MKSFTILSLAAVATALNSSSADFLQYLSKQGKSYASLAEFQKREQLFLAIDAEIKAWNAREDVTSFMGHNFMSDWTQEEKDALLSYTPLAERPVGNYHEAPEDYVQALANFNWCDATANPRGVNECTAVKDQGSCAAGYAFATVETVESAISIIHGVTPVPVLSTQQIISCSGSFQNKGCQGGQTYLSFDYLALNALETDADYPYTSGGFGVTGTCKADTTLGIVETNKGLSNVPVLSYNVQIMSAVDQQPVTSSVDASSTIFQQYTSGVITDISCGITPTQQVVIVGYGTENSTDYWLIRNSWGTSWGEQGFAKLAQAPSSDSLQIGACGVGDEVFYPVIVYPLTA